MKGILGRRPGVRFAGVRRIGPGKKNNKLVAKKRQPLVTNANYSF